MRLLLSILATATSLALCMRVAGADPTPGPSPSPAPSPSPIALHAVLSATEAFTSGVNATGSFDTPTGADLTERFNVSNAFAILAKTSGKLQYAVQGGAYSIPVIGVAGNKTIQSGANTDLYGPVPLADLQYVPTSNFSLSVGVLATLTGQESTFTYEDWNIERGAVWNVENAVSRGFRAAFTSGKTTATLGANDGFYSGKYGAAEASLTFAPDANDSWLVVWLDPNPRTPGNATSTIANKELLNFVVSHTAGKLQLAPYVLYARSPEQASLHYAGDESAFGAAILGNYTFCSTFSTAVRLETLHDSSTPGDASANADLIGYGPGSGINTWTITPAWQLGHGAFVRAEYAHAHVTGSTPGLAFGGHGDGHDQSRVMVEVGYQI